MGDESCWCVSCTLNEMQRRQWRQNDAASPLIEKRTSSAVYRKTTDAYRKQGNKNNVQILSFAINYDLGESYKMSTCQHNALHALYLVFSVLICWHLLTPWHRMFIRYCDGAMIILCCHRKIIVEIPVVCYSLVIDRTKFDCTTVAEVWFEFSRS